VSPDHDRPHDTERTQYSSVKLPEHAEPPFEVFVNGVPQKEGVDYVRKGDTLYFFRPIKQEGKLGFWRWLSIFIGIAGSYKQNDSVDVTFVRDGRRLIETGLPITVLVEPDPKDGMLVGSYSPGG
jgi:hypothetical protein